MLWLVLVAASTEHLELDARSSPLQDRSVYQIQEIFGYLEGLVCLLERILDRQERLGLEISCLPIALAHQQRCREVEEQ